MAYPSLQERPLVWIDVETTGLDETEHEIIEFAALNEETGEVLEFKIWPEHLETATEEALEVNGFSVDEWEKSRALTMSEALPRIVNFLQGAILAGQNVSFDERFIKAAIKTSGKPYKISHHKLDVATLALVHLGPLGARSVSLNSICEYLGIPNEGAHRAMADVDRVRAAYLKLRNPYNDDKEVWVKRIEAFNAEIDKRITKKKLWETIRDYVRDCGGDPGSTTATAQVDQAIEDFRLAHSRR